ncbi:probable Acetoin(diacetyl) reductase [Cephalotrichum gorgonifer]|uniref:Probable Acetoin(Diacetyl) reductase n=1 Tax=Cephalotrichum gorgonifer TaxID=2041049 RepID=A0AAE8MTB4_9PEZI|nr:probable Acetoin(diacetyl) reductase [Cephalotrichum gorgonifer]
MAKVWFVTGSSRGLGRAIVNAALNSGGSVIATARNIDTLISLVEEFAERFLPLQLDVTKDDDVINAVKAGSEKFGRIDVVVNNAGYANVDSIEDIKIEDFREQLDTNFMGAVYVTKAVLPLLRQQGSGHIFQVSTIGGRVGTPGLSAYQSAKWALTGFSTVLAQEVAPLGIKVTILEPGGIRTDFASSSMRIGEITDPYKQTVGAFVAVLGPFVGKEPSLPEKVADIVVNLSAAEDSPLRLLIGPDAADFASKAAQALDESDRKWLDVTASST